MVTPEGFYRDLADMDRLETVALRQRVPGLLACGTGSHPPALRKLAVVLLVLAARIDAGRE